MQILTGHAVRVVVDPGESSEVVNRGPGVVYYGVNYGTSPTNFDGTIAAGATRTFTASTWLATDRNSTAVDVGEAALPAIVNGSNVAHGADAAVARPAGASVTWVGSVRPTNMTAADVWVDTATAAGTVTGLWKPADSSLIGATFDPIFGGNQLALVPGRVSTGRVPLNDSNTINTLEAYVFAAGVTLTNCIAGVWSLTGTLLGQTADQSAAWTTTGLKSMALIAPVTVTGDVVVGLFMGNATTAPQFQFSNNSIPAILNRGLASPAYRGARADGLPGFPAPLPAMTTESRAPWIGVG